MCRSSLRARYTTLTPGQQRAKDGEQITVEGAAGDELKRLGVVLKPVRDGYSLEGLGGDSIKFRGEHLGQSPEDLKALREEIGREVEGAVNEAIRSPGYAEFQTDVERRKYLAHVVANTTRRAMNGFRRETRQEDIRQRQRLEEWQRELENRNPENKGRKDFNL